MADQQEPTAIVVLSGINGAPSTSSIDLAALSAATCSARRVIIGASSAPAAYRAAAEFWAAQRGGIAPHICDLFDREITHLWSVFPAHLRSLARYKELLAVLLAQTADVAWYNRYPRYWSAREVRADVSLCSFERKHSDFEVHFGYVRYYPQLLMRVPNALRLRYRRLINHPGRYTQGLSLTRCTPAIAGLVNSIAEQVQSEHPGMPRRVLLVNSMLRTQQEQAALARIGYIAPRTSSHLTGYAVDIEQTWYRLHDAAWFAAIGAVLGRLFERGEINLIDEHTHWHICLNPALIGNYEAAFERWRGRS